MWTGLVGIEGLMAGIVEGSWPGTELIITFVIEDIHIPSQKTFEKKKQIVNLPLLSIRCHTDPKAQRYMTFFDQPFHATS